MIVVIGGANIDILGFSSDSLIPGDSNPGKIRLSPGGVGRNIAQALARYRPNETVEMLTLLSDDAHSRFVRKETEKHGVSLRHSIIVPGRNCPSYLAVMDRGEMVSAVNDMSLLNELTPELLAPSSSVIEEADMVILDANIPENTIEWLIKTFPKVRFAAEPVSAAKCSRFLPVLKHLFLIKPNRMEAERLTSLGIHDVNGAMAAVDKLLKDGTENVIITLGAGGAVYGSAKGKGHISPDSSVGKVKNTNGAGDAFLAGALKSLQEGKNLEEAARTGSRLAESIISGNLREIDK